MEGIAHMAQDNKILWAVGFLCLAWCVCSHKKNEDTKLHRLFPFGYRNIQIDTQQQSTVSWGVHSNQLHVCKQTQEIRVCPKRKESLRLSHPLHTSCCIDRHLCCVVNQRFATGCDLLDLCRLCSCLLTPEVLLNYLRPMKTIQPNPIQSVCPSQSL